MKETASEVYDQISPGYGRPWGLLVLILTVRNISPSPPTGSYDSECYCSESESESKDDMLLDVDAAADNESES
jgi:hypothetical protein